MEMMFHLRYEKIRKVSVMQWRYRCWDCDKMYVCDNTSWLGCPFCGMDKTGEIQPGVGVPIGLIVIWDVQEL